MGFCVNEEDCVKEFMSAVQEQISYKPIRKTACKELENHLEDKAEEYIKSGMSNELAVLQAVKEMGDPVTVGVKLNESYSLQKEYKLLGLILLSVFGGILSNFVYGYDVFYSSYFYLGVAVLLVVTVYGYRFCVIHRKLLTAVAILYGFVWSGYGIISGILRMKGLPGISEILWRWNADSEGIFSELFSELMLRLFSMTVQFNGMFFMIPFCVILIFPRADAGDKKKQTAGLILSGVFVFAVTVSTALGPTAHYLLSAVSIVIVSYLALSIAAAWKKKNILIPILFSLACFLFLFTYNGAGLHKSIELFATPEKQAVSIWEDGYNGVLIKELLGRSRPVGSVSLTEEEIRNYATGDWYFTGEKDFKMPSYIEEKTQIEDILPQHYLNNYRIAYVIIRYGWVAGCLFLAGLAGLIALLFYTTFQIKNRLGFLLAFGSSMALSMQILIYILGNFGHQLGNFPNLPFISEGIVSIIVNMTLAGIILSAYRYDRVIGEQSATTWKTGRKAQKV